MGKEAVVFLVIVTFNAGFGISNNRYGYEDQEVKKLSVEIATIAEGILKAVENIEDGQYCSWNTYNFAQEIGGVIDYLKDLDEQYGGERSNVIINELRYLCRNVKELGDHNDSIKIRNLGLSLTVTIKNVWEYLERLLITTQHEPYEGVERAVERFIAALRKLHVGLNENPFCSCFEAENQVAEVQVLLEEANLNNIVVKRTFDHLIREYLGNLREVHLAEYLQPIASASSGHDIGMHVYHFISTMITEVNHQPTTTRVAFIKATRIFHNRLKTMVKTINPIRHLRFQIQATVDFLTSSLDVFPLHSDILREGIVVVALEFCAGLRRILPMIQESRQNEEIILNIKGIMEVLENDLSLHTLNSCLKKVSTEFHKWLISHTDGSDRAWRVGTQFLDDLQAFKKLLIQVGLNAEDVNLYSMHIFATSNRLSMYFKGEIKAEHLTNFLDDIKDLIETINANFEQQRDISKRLVEALVDLEGGRYEISDFLQKISLEINELLWYIYKQEGFTPQELKLVIVRYVLMLYDLHLDFKVVRALQTVQNPSEIALNIKDVADRLTKMLHVRVPGFKHRELTHRAHNFYEMLEVAIYRLQKIAPLRSKYGYLLHEVLEQLCRIRDGLRNDIEHPDLDLNVKLCVHVQNTVEEFAKIALDEHNDRLEIIKMFGDFLFGLNHIQNQIEFDFEIVTITEQHDSNMLNMQIQAVSGLLQTFLQRSKFKPQLSGILVHQFDVLSRVVEALSKTFQTISLYELAEKYSTMHEQLMTVITSGWHAPVEELAKQFGLAIKSIVEDLQYLAYMQQHENTIFREACRHTLVILSNIMVRMQNIHYYEYYHSMVNNTDMVAEINKMGKLASTKLKEFTMEDSTDLAIHTFRYAHRLEKVTERLQVEASLSPYTIIDTISALQSLGHLPNVEQVKTEFGRCILKAGTSLATILKQDTPVGTTHAIIKHTVAAEKLFMHLENILLNNKAPKTLGKLSSHIDSHVRYLTKSLEQVRSDDEDAVGVLRTGYLYITRIIERAYQIIIINGDTKSYIQIVNKCLATRARDIESYDIDDFRILISVCIQRTAVLLKEVAWILSIPLDEPGMSEKTLAIKSVFDDFLMALQHVQIQIENKILITNKNWGKITSGVVLEKVCGNLENGKIADLLDIPGAHHRDISRRYSIESEHKPQEFHTSEDIGALFVQMRAVISAIRTNFQNVDPQSSNRNNRIAKCVDRLIQILDYLTINCQEEEVIECSENGVVPVVQRVKRLLMYPYIQSSNNILIVLDQLSVDLEQISRCCAQNSETISLRDG